MRRALISVFDKTGITEFAKELKKYGFDIISTGGTFKHLEEAGLEPIEISDVTGFPEMMDGRVKTLHPMIHGGLLSLRDNQDHMAITKEFNIRPIDIVVVNLYPFKKEVKTDKSFEKKIEFIDIGGPAMLRSAAKNFKFVTAITDPNDYKRVVNELSSNEGDISIKLNKELAAKVFDLTSSYDSAIYNFLNSEV